MKKRCANGAWQSMAACLSLLLSCAWTTTSSAEPMPEFYGIYAVDGGRLYEMKDVKDVTLSVSPKVRFIYFHKAVAYGAPEVGVRRLAWLRTRSELTGNFGGFDGSRPTNAKKTTKSINEWGIWTQKAQEDIAQLRAKPVSGQPEMIEFVPSEPMAEGAYDLMVGESSEGRFFVGKLPTSEALEQSADCIDIEFWGTLSGVNQNVLRCQESTAAVTSTTGAPSSGAANATGSTVPAESQSTAQVAAAAVDQTSSPLAGAWSGKIYGKRIGSQAMIQIDNAAIGSSAGRTEYFLRSVTGFNNLACRGSLHLIEANAAKYTFEEKVVEKGRGYDGGCPIAGRLELTLSGSSGADGRWITSDSKSTMIQSGALQKQ